jgi:3'(2'), 5'-bisphosphate nucleotidase
VQQPTTELAAALAAGRAAADAIAFLGDPQSFAAGAVIDKGAAGPATVADIASQVAATITLRAMLGGAVRIVAEESLEEVDSLGGDSLLATVAAAVRAAGIECDASRAREALAAASDAGGAGTFWAIDPLDGTKGYLRGGQFAVAIALVRDGIPMAGVLGLPRLAAIGTGMGAGVLAAAVRGQGAVQTPLSSWEPLPINARPWNPGDAIRLAGSVEKGHSASDSLESRAAQLGPVEPVRVDSQAKYALVARGDADTYLRLSPTPDYRECIWDHAAGALVASEAGCTVTDSRGVRMDFSTGRRLTAAQGVICAPPRLHAALVDALAPLVG